MVAQSIIPGILQGDQQSRLLYGAVEQGSRIRVSSSSRREEEEEEEEEEEGSIDCQ